MKSGKLDVMSNTMPEDDQNAELISARTQAEAREQAVRKLLVGDFFPYRAYSATTDQDVRAEHMALESLGLNGTNIYNAEDPVWRKFRPPWDYGCRCCWHAVSVRQAAQRGVVEAQEWLARSEAIASERGGTQARYLAETAPDAFQFVPMPPFDPPPEFRERVSS